MTDRPRPAGEPGEPGEEPTWRSGDARDDDEGGDPPCWAHLFESPPANAPDDEDPDRS
jgi:hypothetical protein